MARDMMPETLDETSILTKDDLCRVCQVDAAWIDELHALGVLESKSQGRAYSAVSIRTITRARRLERDFALNMPGVALALDLLDEIERLRAEVRKLR